MLPFDYRLVAHPHGGAAVVGGRVRRFECPAGFEPAHTASESSRHRLSIVALTCGYADPGSCDAESHAPLTRAVRSLAASTGRRAAPCRCRDGCNTRVMQPQNPDSRTLGLWGCPVHSC